MEVIHMIGEMVSKEQQNLVNAHMLNSVRIRVKQQKLKWTLGGVYISDKGQSTRCGEIDLVYFYNIDEMYKGRKYFKLQVVPGVYVCGCERYTSDYVKSSEWNMMHFIRTN